MPIPAYYGEPSNYSVTCGTITTSGDLRIVDTMWDTNLAWRATATSTGDLRQYWPRDLTGWTSGSVADVYTATYRVEVADWVRDAEVVAPPQPLPPAVQIRARARRRVLGDAERRAEELLELCLGRQAVREWRAYSSVRVTGSLGGVYDVGPQHSGGWSGQVVQHMPDGGVLRWCCHATMSELPVLDQVVSLAMQIRHDESGFLLTANNHGPATEEFSRRVQRRRLFRERVAA